jgi:hypothetical protein
MRPAGTYFLDLEKRPEEKTLRSTLAEHEGNLHPERVTELEVLAVNDPEDPSAGTLV